MAEDKLVVALSADIKDLQSKLKQAQTELGNYANKSEQSTKGIAGGFDSITTSIKGLVGAYLGLQAAQNALTTAFNNSLKQDALESSFKAIFGNAEQGARQLDRLKAKADELGLEFVTLADSYKLFAASTTQAGMSISETNRIFDSVSKAASNLKISSQDTERALRALAQMMSKGTVLSEELKQQLGDALPGAFGLAAKAMGVTTGELIKMLESGEVMASDLLPRLATQLDKTFGGNTQSQVISLTTEWNRFKNSVFNSTSGFGKLFAIIIKGFTDVYKQLSGDLKSLFSPEQYKADQVFNNLNKAISDTANSIDLKALVANLKQIQSTLEVGTPMYKAYGNAIKEAELKIKDFNSESGKTTKQVNSIEALENQLKKLTEQYKSVEIGSKRFNELGIEIDKVRAKLDALKVKDISGKVKFEMPTMDSQFLTADVDLKGLEDAVKPISDFQAQTNLLNQNLKELEVIGGAAFTPIQIGLDTTKQKTEEVNASLGNIVTVLGQGLTGAFEQAISGTESFGQAFAKMIKQLIARLLAAIAAAAALAAIITIASGGANLTTSLGKLGIKGGFAGLLNLTSGGLLGGGTGDRVVSAVGAGTNQGNVSFEIRGDKLYGVLQNYQSRLDRLQ